MSNVFGDDFEHILASCIGGDKIITYTDTRLGLVAGIQKNHQPFGKNLFLYYK